MHKAEYRIRAKVWLYPGVGGWHFVTVPKEQSAEIKGLFGMASRGWGSLPVAATIGQTQWNTSIFPDRKAGTYLLALKAEVRKRERIDIGDTIAATIRIR